MAVGAFDATLVLITAVEHSFHKNRVSLSNPEAAAVAAIILLPFMAFVTIHGLNRKIPKAG